MLRGILLSKIKNNGIELIDLNNFVKEMNEKILQTKEIPDDEYQFTFLISEKYSQNLKIIMPKFEPLDIFYFFFQYDKNKCYKLGEIFNEIKYSFGGINDITERI